MKSKQHEYILKAFLNSSIPTVIRRGSPELMVIDSVIGGYCSQLIRRSKLIELPSSEIISKAEKAVFSELINQSTGIEKNELVVYYRLVILVESILIQYRQWQIPASIALGYPSTDLSGIYPKPLRAWDYPTEQLFCTQKAVRWELVHSRSLVICKYFVNIQNWDLHFAFKWGNGWGDFSPSGCYSHGKGDNYGKGQADCWRVLSSTQNPEGVFTAVFLSSAVALTERRHHGIIKETEQSRDSLCSEKGTTYGASEEWANHLQRSSLLQTQQGRWAGRRKC